MHCGAPPRKTRTNITKNDTKDSHVSFDDARYKVSCPTCQSRFIISGKLLGSKESIRCPNKHVDERHQIIDVNSISEIELFESSISYGIISDYFSYSGRISVRTYWLSSLIVLPFLLLIKFIGIAGPILFFGLLHSLWWKRYQDHGFSGKWIAVQGITAVASTFAMILIPQAVNSNQNYPVFSIFYATALLASVLTGILITLVPAKQMINRYGPPTSIVRTRLFN
jgi:uncharacterized membrane protein YhaH (DUF805 family)